MYDSIVTVTVNQTTLQNVRYVPVMGLDVIHFYFPFISFFDLES